MRYYTVELTGAVTRITMNPVAQVVGLPWDNDTYTASKPPTVVIQDPTTRHSLDLRQLVARHVVLVSPDILNGTRTSAPFAQVTGVWAEYDFDSINEESRFLPMGSLRFKPHAKDPETWMLFVEEFITERTVSGGTTQLSALRSQAVGRSQAVRRSVENEANVYASLS